MTSFTECGLNIIPLSLYLDSFWFKPSCCKIQAVLPSNSRGGDTQHIPMSGYPQGTTDEAADKPAALLPIPSGPPCYPLIGNQLDFGEGFHVVGPKLVAEYGGFFTVRPPSAYFAQPLHLLGGPIAIVADPALLEEMYNRHDDFQKRLFKHSQLRSGLAGNGLFTSDDDEPIHDQAARILLPAFSLNGMKEYFNIIVDNTKTLMSIFDRYAGSSKPLDLHPLLSQFTFEVIGEVGFGRKFNAMTEQCDFLDLFEEISEVNVELKRMQWRSTRIISAIVTGQARAARAIQDKIKKQLQKLIAVKKEAIQARCPVTDAIGAGCPVKDLAERMLSVPDPQSGELLPEENALNQTATFLVAGHDSTSTAITMLLYHLAQHPEVEERVQQEVFSIVGDGPITWDALGKMNYCTQVVKENLRMYAPAAQFIKASPPDRATQLGPYAIPPGTTLVISTWGLHHNPCVYPDPEKFDPDRWSPENAAKRSPYAWLPFSYGKRACIGMQLSLIEQRLVLAELVRRFHIRLDLSTNIVTTIPLFLNPQGIFLKVAHRGQAPPPAVTLPTAANSAPTASVNIGRIEELKGRCFVVLFGSNMGTCEDFADRAFRHGMDMGMECSKYPLDVVCQDSLALPKGDEGVVVVITSTYNGQPPDNARKFDKWLESPAATSKLQGVCFAIFGCGNKQWAATYQKFPNKVYSSFEALGGSCIAPMGEGDMDSGEAEFAFARWTIGLSVGMLRTYHIAVPESIKDALYPRLPEYDAFLWTGKRAQDLFKGGELPKELSQDILRRAKAAFLKDNKAWSANVSCNRELLQCEDRSTRHLEIDLPDGVQYIAGDHLGVVAANPSEVVLAYLDRLKIAHDSVFKMEIDESDGMSFVPLRQPLSAFSMLAWFVELQQPVSRVQLRALSKLAQIEGEQKHLLKLSEWPEDENEDLYEATVKKKRLTVLEILNEYSSIELTLGQLLGLLPANKPRYYSISSSPKMLPGAVNITVSVVSGTSPTGRKHLGLCSNFLQCQPDMLCPASVVSPQRPMRSFTVFVKDTGSSFRLPKSHEVPIIMVGPGTGLAPMRGFIQDRVAEGAKENILFFGCRNEQEFLYREELEAWVKDGFLDLHVAFSRSSGKPKVYVQQLVQQQSSKMVELVKRGAHIYICGDASRMAPDVKITFSRLFAAAGLGDALIEDMVAEGHYCEDVWAAQAI